MGVKCFYVEITDKCKVYLRRYSVDSFWKNDIKYLKLNPLCIGNSGYSPDFHNAEILYGIYPIPYTADKVTVDEFPMLDHNHPLWKHVAVCKCGYEFDEYDHYQMFVDDIYIDKANGREHSLRTRTPGMMWNAPWRLSFEKNQVDGKYLCVICPDGLEWDIDSQARNCTMKTDNVHKCWIRHGTPPIITVDKAGLTCGAGAGSIQTYGHKDGKDFGSYHGFLRNGEFT